MTEGKRRPFFVSGWECTDARGRRVEMINPLRGPSASKSLEMSADELKRVRDEAGWVLGRRGFSLLLPAGLLVQSVVFTIRAFERGEWVRFSVFLVLTVLMFAGMLAVARFGFGRNPIKFAEAMLRRGRCPRCAYDLAALRSEAEDITTCPECGAAWKLEERGLEGRE